MENNSIGSMMESTLSKMREIVNVDTVIGTPITTSEGVTVIPVSRISYGFATGGTDFYPKDAVKSSLAAGNGAGIKIDPVCFLVIRGDNIRMINVAPPANNTVDRVIEKAPELIDTVEGLIRKYTAKKDEDFD